MGGQEGRSWVKEDDETDGDEGQDGETVERRQDRARGGGRRRDQRKGQWQTGM